jgi:hypothetical protein
MAFKEFILEAEQQENKFSYRASCYCANQLEDVSGDAENQPI